MVRFYQCAVKMCSKLVMLTNHMEVKLDTNLVSSIVTVLSPAWLASPQIPTDLLADSPRKNRARLTRLVKLLDSSPSSLRAILHDSMIGLAFARSSPKPLAARWRAQRVGERAGDAWCATRWFSLAPYMHATLDLGSDSLVADRVIAQAKRLMTSSQRLDVGEIAAAMTSFANMTVDGGGRRAPSSGRNLNRGKMTEVVCRLDQLARHVVCTAAGDDWSEPRAREQWARSSATFLASQPYSDEDDDSLVGKMQASWRREVGEWSASERDSQLAAVFVAELFGASGGGDEEWMEFVEKLIR